MAVVDIEFAKLAGSGNDFICIDGRDGRFDELVSSLHHVGHFARILCRRGLGVGADGVIFAVQPEIEGVSDIGARIFEPDGSEAELCGNGTACFIHWAFVNQWVPSGEIKVLTPAGVVRGTNGEGDYVRVCIPLPEHMQTELELTVEGRPWKCDFAIIGVPHAVSFVDDVEKIDVGRWGPAIRRHQRFQPRGANANFVQVLSEGQIALRTWEFGVEGETLACGTGSAAAAIFAAVRNHWAREYLSGQKPVCVHARGGDVLKVYFTIAADGAVVDPCLETSVRFIYSGVIGRQTAEKALGRNAGPGA